VVFGDDHIWCAPKLMRNILSVNDFQEFLIRSVDMTLQDQQEYEEFLSVPDDMGGFFKGNKNIKIFKALFYS